MTKRDELAGLKARFAALTGTDGPCAWCGSTDYKRKRTNTGTWCVNQRACNRRKPDLSRTGAERVALAAEVRRVPNVTLAKAQELDARAAGAVFTGRQCPACHWHERAPVESLCRVCRAPMLTPSPETLARIEEERDSIAHLPRNLGGGGKKRR